MVEVVVVVVVVDSVAMTLETSVVVVVVWLKSVWRATRRGRESKGWKQTVVSSTIVVVVVVVTVTVDVVDRKQLQALLTFEDA